MSDQKHFEVGNLFFLLELCPLSKTTMSTFCFLLEVSPSSSDLPLFGLLCLSCEELTAEAAGPGILRLDLLFLVGVLILSITFSAIFSWISLCGLSGCSTRLTMPSLFTIPSTIFSFSPSFASAISGLAISL